MQLVLAIYIIKINVQISRQSVILQTISIIGIIVYCNDNIIHFSTSIKYFFIFYILFDYILEQSPTIHISNVFLMKYLNSH